MAAAGASSEIVGEEATVVGAWLQRQLVLPPR